MDEVGLVIRVALICMFMGMFALVYAYNLTLAGQTGNNIQLTAQNQSFSLLQNRTNNTFGNFVNFTHSFDPHPISNTTVIPIIGINYGILYNLPLISVAADFNLAVWNFFKFVGSDVWILISIVTVMLSVFSAAGLGIFAPIATFLIVGVGIVLLVLLIYFITLLINRLNGGGDG